jgi:hypothetical protein
MACASFMFAMFRRNVAHSIEVWTQQDLEELDNRMGNSEANEDGGMEEETLRKKINHRSRTTRRSTDGMLGCLIFKFSVTSNNLIGSFVLPHTPNGHAGLPVLNRPPRLWWQRPTLRQRSAAGTCSDHSVCPWPKRCH